MAREVISKTRKSASFDFQIPPDVGLKNSAAPYFFNQLLGVGKSVEILSSCLIHCFKFFSITAYIFDLI